MHSIRKEDAELIDVQCPRCETDVDPGHLDPSAATVSLTDRSQESGQVNCHTHNVDSSKFQYNFIKSNTVYEYWCAHMTKTGSLQIALGNRRTSHWPRGPITWWSIGDVGQELKVPGSGIRLVKPINIILKP